MEHVWMRGDWGRTRGEVVIFKSTGPPAIAVLGRDVVQPGVGMGKCGDDEAVFGRLSRWPCCLPTVVVSSTIFIAQHESLMGMIYLQ